VEQRIQSILQRLQELYYAKHQKSAIDIDLMLDYTRVMYADLLALKQNIAPSPGNMSPGEDISGSKDGERATISKTESLENKGEPTIQPVQAVVENEITESPEQQVSELILEEERGISFEPPHPVNHADVIDEVLVEEDPVINEPVENIEITVPVISKEIASAAAARDIRSGIGINDKYLFLNELFNNHKTEYEETLDHINRFSGYEEAHNWLSANAAVNNKWTEEDETVQSFLSVLKKHFSASR